MQREASSLDKFIMNIINRFAWPRWPAKQLCLNRSKTITFIGKRKRVFFKCEMCKKEGFSQKDVEVDHIEPRIDPIMGFQGIEEFIKRTFVDLTGLMLLCKECHRKKSEQENEIRREIKNEKATKPTRNTRRNSKATPRRPSKSSKMARR